MGCPCATVFATVLKQIFHYLIDVCIWVCPNISLWNFPSIGSSPVIKWIDGVDAVTLNLRIDFNVFLWKSASGSTWLDLRAKKDRPDLVLEHLNVLKIWSFTTGLSILKSELKANTFWMSSSFNDFKPAVYRLEPYTNHLNKVVYSWIEHTYYLLSCWW